VSSAPPSNTERKTSVLRSAALTVAMRWADRLIGFISTLILARLLVPDDFGIVAMCSLVIGLVDVLLDLGVGIALIQNRGATILHYHTAWTLRLGQTTVGMMVVIIGAPLAAKYFGDPRLTIVLQVMSIGLFMAGLENIGVVDFQKKMRFGMDFKFAFSKRIVGFAITVVAAWLLRSYWALVAGALASRVFGVVLSYLMHPMRPRLCLAKFREIFAVSQWMLARSTGLYLDASLHRILVGGRDSAAVLGGYTLANDVSAMPATELLAPLNRVLFPAFVRASHDRRELRRLYLLAQGLQTLVAIPASVGLAMVAREAVPILLGEKWTFAVPFVQLLALASVVQAITTSGGYVLITLARVRQAAMLIWVQVALFAALAFIAIPAAHALELAQLRLLTVVGGLSLAIGLLRRVLPEVSLMDVIRTIARPLLATAAMAAALFAVGNTLALPLAGMLILKIGVGLLVYSLSILLMWRLSGKPDGAESYVLAASMRVLRRA